MSFTADRVMHLQRSLQLALNQEWPQLQQTQRKLAQFKARVIQPLQSGGRAMPIIATVATDGGENHLNLEPIRLQVVRVADSSGEIHFEDFVARSLPPEEVLRLFFSADHRLKKFLDYLQVDWRQLLPRSDFQLGQLLSMLRESMEWAALLKLAGQPPAKLLIRDGLLRSMLLTEEVFQRLSEKFEWLTTQYGHLLVGVAKRSRVINYLSVAVGLNESFADGQPSYLPVPVELE